MSLLDEIKWIEFPSIEDSRGTLTAIEKYEQIPFEINRIFYMHGITSDRGGHAHIDTHQVITAVNGSFDISFEDENNIKTFKLDDPQRGLYMPPLVFTSMKNFTVDAAALVTASTNYDIAKSLRTKSDYLEYIRRFEGK